MARATTSDAREEKTSDELRKLIADALNESDPTGARALSPDDIAIVTQPNSRGAWSYGVKEAAGSQSQIQQHADQQTVSELNKKYKITD